MFPTQISNINSLKVSELYKDIIKYLVILFIKFSKNGTYKRWNRSDRLVIYFHDIPCLMSQLNFRETSSTNIEVYNNYIEIVNKNSLDDQPQFINIANLSNIDKNRSTLKKLLAYIKKNELVKINLITNLNCILFLIIACEINNKNNVDMFKNLIYYSPEDKLYKFKYSISQIYNFVDFKVSRKSVKFNFITSDEGVSLVFNGILFAFNNMYQILNIKDYIKFILVPAINAITFLMHNNKKYKKELVNTILNTQENVISEIKKHRLQIQKDSQSILSEVIIDNILDIKKNNTNNSNKSSIKEKYIIENTETDEIWKFIYSYIKPSNINPVFVILYFLINDRFFRIKGFMKDLYLNNLFISALTNKQNKKDIYEILYLQYKGCRDLKDILNEDLYNYYIVSIRNNLVGIQKIYCEFTDLFNKFNISDLDLDTIKSVIHMYTYKNDKSCNTNLDKLNISIFTELNLNQYQYQAIIKMQDKEKFILSLEQGMGKTRTIISEILYLYNYCSYSNFIAIIPATYIYIWETEIEKVRRILIQMPKITIVSLEQYRLKSLDFLIEKCFKNKNIFDIKDIYLCIDESIVIKNQDSKNYKCCKKITGLMEMIRILKPSFSYRIRMTTGTIQSESINDWKYVSSFLFNLKENAINLEVILDSLIYKASYNDKHKNFKDELLKFRSISNMVLIQRRKELNVNVINNNVNINFWENNPFNGIIQFFHYIKNHLNSHIYNISDIIGKHSIDVDESNKLLDENNFNNLNKALKSGKINNLIKDLNINKSDISSDISIDLINRYQKYKMKFLWTLREMAEIIMPFKIYGFFYNLDAGIISNKIIPKVIMDNYVFEKLNSKHRDAYNYGSKIIREYRNIEIKDIDQVNNKKIESTTSSVLDKLNDYTLNISNRIKEAIEIYIKATCEIEENLFRVNSVLYYIIESALIKNYGSNDSCSFIKDELNNYINSSDIIDLSDYFKISNESSLLNNAQLFIEKIISTKYPNGILYYNMKLEFVAKCIEDEINKDHTMILFFELKSHIKIFKEFIESRYNYNILELDARNKDRDKIVSKLNNREVSILLTTYSLAARGFSFNNTNTIIFFMPTSQYDLYTQAKYRNNRLDSKLDTIYHFNFRYDILSINNKLYSMYIKKEITKNLIENILVMPYDKLIRFYNITDKSEVYFNYLYEEISNFIKSNEISKEDYISGLCNIND